MAAKKATAPSALMTVIDALEPLSDTDRQWVLQSAAARWTLNVQLNSSGGLAQTGGGGPAGAGAASSSANAGDAQAAITRKDPRAFIRAKKPATDVERVACLGYYLVKTAQKPGFTSKEIKQTHTDSGGSKINMARALDNATRQSKYLSTRGHREKQLTTLGEDVVEALPDRQAVEVAEAAAKTSRGRKGKGKNKK